MAEDTTISVVYMGLKRPKIISLTSRGRLTGPGQRLINEELVEKHAFEPFVAKEVSAEFGGKLLLGAGDIFKRVDKDERAPDPEPEAKGNGYVGDRTADTIEDYEKQVQRETQSEEGKDIDDLKKDEEELKEKKRKKRKTKVQAQKEREQIINQ